MADVQNQTSSRRLGRALTESEREMGLALVRLGLHPSCVLSLFSTRAEEPERAVKPTPTAEEMEARKRAYKEAKKASSKAWRAAMSPEQRKAWDHEQYLRRKLAAEAKREGHT